MTKLLNKNCRIKNFHISFYSIILGLSGFVIALNKIEGLFTWFPKISFLFLLAVTFLFVIITILYLIKIFKYSNQVRNEFNSPVKLSFFPTFSISLLLLSIAYLPFSLLISRYLWIFGTLFHLFFNRIFFHQPLPEKLLPTLTILIAPPAVGFISLVKLQGEITDFSKLLYYFSLFILMLLIFQVKKFTKIKFYLSWWAYSFPISAITIANILMFHQTKFKLFENIAIVLFIFLIFLLVLLLVKTFKAINQREICVEED